MRVLWLFRAELSTGLGLGRTLRAKNIVEELIDIRLADARLAESREEALGVVQVFFGGQMVRMTPQSVAGVGVEALEDGRPQC